MVFDTLKWSLFLGKVRKKVSRYGKSMSEKRGLASGAVTTGLATGRVGDED